MAGWARGRYLSLVLCATVLAVPLGLMAWWVQSRLSGPGGEGRLVIGWEWVGLLLTPLAVAGVEGRLKDFEAVRRPAAHEVVAGIAALAAVPFGLVLSGALLTRLPSVWSSHTEFGVTMTFPEMYGRDVAAKVLLNAVVFGAVALICNRYLGTVMGTLGAWAVSLSLLFVQGVGALRNLVPLQDDAARWHGLRVALAVAVIALALGLWASSSARLSRARRG